MVSFIKVAYFLTYFYYLRFHLTISNRKLKGEANKTIIYTYKISLKIKYKEVALVCV